MTLNDRCVRLIVNCVFVGACCFLFDDWCVLLIVRSLLFGVC